jgi:putative tryptophan/tyrosine transport system substrate-binding protein
MFVVRRREFMMLLGGAAAAWPLEARAQQPAMPMIGFMSSRSPADSVTVVAAFHRGLGEGGLIEGKNVVIEFRWASGEYGRLPALAAELVSRQVAVLVAAGGDSSALAAKAATSTIPIVFGSGDPIKTGLVASLNRPGGNATGVHILSNDLEPKRLGLLHELFPGAALFGALLNPKFPPAAQQALELAEAARTIGRPVVLLNASTDAELDAAFATLARQRVAAMLVAADPFFDTRRDQIIAFAAQQKLPAIYHFREYAVAGGLMSYGVSLSEAYRGVGIYAARILNGEKPANLPVMQSVKFELVINLKTAKTLGFEFPPTFSARADEVIE